MHEPQRPIGLFLLTLLVASACGGDPASRPALDDWMRKGKLAGLEVYQGMSDALLSTQLDALVDQHVDVVIADSSLSNYKTDTEFSNDLKLLSRVAREAHARGLRVVWYLTTLEVQTVGGKNKTSTMAKDHPAWLQVGLNGKKNVFYGGQEDWVEADDESAWMCPRSPYREYFLARIRKLAQSGVDGIWADVPLFMDTGVRWTCHCKHHREHFKQQTTHDLPAREDWSDPVWRRWINYRHEDLNDFLMAIHGAAREVNPALEVVIEIFTTDYNDAMDKGLDGSFTGAVEGLSKAWEIDSVSNMLGMLYATPDDWMSKIAMTKFARGADKGRPTWVFAYGNTEWDAQMVMAVAFSAQTNTYETKTPEMARTVGAAFRKRIYSWADPHKDAIYDSEPAARVAVLYSSLSRDYLDHHYGYAMFNSTTPPLVESEDLRSGEPYSGPDREWWSDEIRDSVTQLEHLGEYRGFVKALAHLHRPFTVEAMQRQSLERLKRYRALVAPSLNALTDEQAKLLGDYVRGGGNLILTGLDPAGLDGYGGRRERRALAELLGFDGELPARGSTTAHQVGQGSVRFFHGLLGLRYLRSGAASALATIGGLLEAAAGAPPLETDADKMVYLDLYRYASGDTDQLLLHVVNLVGADGSGKVPDKPQQVKVTLELPTGFKPGRAWVSSPDEGAADEDLEASVGPRGVTITVPVKHYAIARVELAPTGQPADGAILTLALDWPRVPAGGPGATARVTGDGLLGARTGHLAPPRDGGPATLSLVGLPPGNKTVELLVVDPLSGAPLTRLTRQVTLSASGETKLTLSPGASTSGPGGLALEAHDRIFLVNNSAAPASVKTEGLARELDPGEWASARFDAPGSYAYAIGSQQGSVTVAAADKTALTPVVEAISAAEGFAGHSVILSGRGFGTAPGTVSWGGAACVVTSWGPSEVIAHLPSDATPATKDLVLEVSGQPAAGKPFSVRPASIELSAAIKRSFAFVRDKMRSKEGGVYTNLNDRTDPPDAAAVYPYGHHMTAEHMGLMLWVSAALLDHRAFEQSYRFVHDKMVSPRRDVVNWAIHKKTDEPMLQREDDKAPWLNSNAPLDDFRVVKGLISGWQQWRDRRYRDLALRIGRGLLDTSISRRDDFADHPGGLVAYAYNWPETQGLGVTDVGVIPIDYADLWTMRWLADHDPRWREVIKESIRLMEKAQLPSGQFYNSYLQETRELSGDFEYRDTIAGQKVKAIQSLWIAIHLARAGRKATAQRALDFYKQQYASKQRIAEYLNYDGSDCSEKYFEHTLSGGEARIYAQVARLAFYLGDETFGDTLIEKKILPDQEKSIDSPTFGNIGKSTAGEGDAEAWNNLESLLALALARGSRVVSAVFEDDSGL